MASLTSPSVTPDDASLDPLRIALERAVGAQYDIVRLLGRGGMGAVFLARDRALERLVAIKVLNPESSSTPESRERFRREARTAAGLTHPDIVPLHSFGEADETMYFVMGYVPGESLARRLRRDRRIPPEEAARILAELADALDYAHRQGIVHRDIKPDNVLLDDATGRAMLADFGIARAGSAVGTLTQDGIALGTPQYMSPEQAAGEREIDGRSDLYSLGVTGYQMLSGQLPFEATSFRELLAQHLSRAPAPLRSVAPGTPSTIAAAVMRCLAKEPSARWPDGRTLRDALAPDGLQEEQLPERVRIFDALLSSAAMLYLVLAGTSAWMNSHAEWPGGRTRFIAVAFTGGASLLAVLFVGAYLVLGRHCGFTTRDIVRAVFRQPHWWYAWYPRALRRPGSSWERLPIAVKVVRTALFVLVAGAVALAPGLVTWVIIPFSPLPPSAKARLVSSMILMYWLPLTVAIVVVGVVWGRLRGLAALDASDLLFRDYARRHPFWRQPKIAALLRPSPSATTEVPDEPQSTRECYERILELAHQLVTKNAALGASVLETSRSALERLEALERDADELARDHDPTEAARVGQRLATLGSAGGGEGEERRQLRALLEEQVELARRMESRIEDARQWRRRIADLLKELWRELAADASGSRTDAIGASCDALAASLAPDDAREPAPVETPTDAGPRLLRR